jgi:hypothetical protein
VAELPLEKFVLYGALGIHVPRVASPSVAHRKRSWLPEGWQWLQFDSVVGVGTAATGRGQQQLASLGTPSRAPRRGTKSRPTHSF